MSDIAQVRGSEQSSRNRISKILMVSNGHGLCYDAGMLRRAPFFILALFALALLPVKPPGARAGQIYPDGKGEFATEYDRFKDVTTVTLLQVGVFEKQYDFDYQRIYLSLAAQLNSRKPSLKPEKIMVMFTSWSMFNNRYLQPAELCLIVNGVRWPCSIMQPISRREINGKFVASMGITANYERVASLATAERVEARLGDVEFSLDAAAKKRVGEFLQQVTP